jgi:geranylgeranyl diphosphate synthase type II
MDNAPIRRTKATVHEKWNNNVAILSGDAMLIQSYQYLSGVEPEILKSVLTIFNKMAIEVCEGQQYDMDFEIQAEVSIASYLKMIEFKTAVLLASSLQIGALIGGANSKEAYQLYLFGRDLGIAFQLKDDLLDVFGNQMKFGKQLGGDIIANKKTFLYLQAIDLADSNLKMELVNLYTSVDINPTEKVERVKDIYSFLNIEKSTLEMIDKYYQKAMRNLHKVKGDKSELEAFAAMLKVRES